jgi:DNA mismatch repair protein MLH3
MASADGRIKPLPSTVIAQIRSSICIHSLNAVISELVKNSLDANASHVQISLDFPKGNCIVEDDGCGIHPAEFAVSGGLGKRHRQLEIYQIEILGLIRFRDV